ncbi:hypothetical protein GH714_039314 [Hevea brasiliensis]|nr:hypothetical protein GH714_039314 [Hevea brasiliensis]
MQCSNTEVGAGTMNPLTFLRVLGPEPWNVAYVEPSIRPDDSRYRQNPNCLQRHTQFQIAEALLEITLPRFSGDVLPKTAVGISLAVADRLDSLIGLFAAGCQPISTNDPFGLWRISYGLMEALSRGDMFPKVVETYSHPRRIIFEKDVARNFLVPLYGSLVKRRYFPKVVEAYSHPRRIVHGKDVDFGVEVDEAVFEIAEERAL